MSYPPEIVQLMAAIVAHGYASDKVALAGGCCRDLMHGEVPKDWDIVIVAQDHPILPMLASLPLGWEVTASYDKHYHDAPVESDFCNNLVAVYTLRHNNGLQADLLYQNNAVDTVYGAVCRFDFNINQFVAGFLSVCAGHPPIYIGKNRHTLERVPGSTVSLNRHHHIVEKAFAYGWDANLTYSERVHDPE